MAGPLPSSHAVRSLRCLATIAASALLASAFDAEAAECVVPGTHASIQSAIDSADCDPIRLAAQSYFESPAIARSLDLVGAGHAVTTVWGRVRVEGSAVAVRIEGLSLYSGCAGPALLAAGGAHVRPADVVVARSATAPCNAVLTLFADGFE